MSGSAAAVMTKPAFRKIEWLPRDIAHMCRSSHLQPKVHLSVLERIAHGSENYCPGNLPANAQVVFTPSSSRRRRTREKT